MNKIRLRPHHLICLNFFVDKGYNEAFTDNMNIIYQEYLTKEIIIVEGKDDLCQSCPNLLNEDCQSPKAKRYDENIKTVCNMLTIDKIKELIVNNQWQTICFDCEWFSICQKISEERT